MRQAEENKGWQGSTRWENTLRTSSGQVKRETSDLSSVSHKTRHQSLETASFMKLISQKSSTAFLWVWLKVNIEISPLKYCKITWLVPPISSNRFSCWHRFVPQSLIKPWNVPFPTVSWHVKIVSVTLENRGKTQMQIPQAKHAQLFNCDMETQRKWDLMMAKIKVSI